MPKKDEWIRLFGTDNIDNIQLSGRSENAIEDAIKRAYYTSPFDQLTEDKIRKGLQYHTKVLEHNNIPGDRNLNAVKMFVAPGYTTTGFFPETGLIYINPDDLESSDAAHELEHFFETTSMGMPVVDKASQQYYNYPTIKSPVDLGQVTGTGGLKDHRVYRPLLDMGADYYGAGAYGYGYGTEHYPQIFTRTTAAPGSAQDSMIQKMGLTTVLTPAILDDITEAMRLASTGIQDRLKRYQSPKIQDLGTNDSVVQKATINLKRAMKKVASAQEELRVRLAYYHNAAKAHIKHAMTPGQINKSAFSKNYDILGINRPNSFDTENINELRQILRVPVPRIPNHSIIDFDQRYLPKQVHKKTSNIIAQPLFD